MDSLKSRGVNSISKRTREMVNAVLLEKNEDSNNVKNVSNDKVDNVKKTPNNIIKHVGTECNSSTENQVACDDQSARQDANLRVNVTENLLVQKIEVLASHENLDPNILHETPEKTSNKPHINFNILCGDLDKENTIITTVCEVHDVTMNTIDINGKSPLNRIVRVKQESNSCLTSNNDDFRKDKAINSDNGNNVKDSNNDISCLTSINGDFRKDQGINSDTDNTFKDSHYDTNNYRCSISTKVFLNQGEYPCSNNTKYNLTEEHIPSDFSEDDDDSVKDRNYETDSSSSSSTSSSSGSSSSSSSCSSSAPLASSNVVVEEEENESIKNQEKKLTRKRSRNESEWIRNKTKRLRNAGKEYVSTGKQKQVIPAKTIKADCGEKCKFRCNKKITEEQRLTLFSEFYNSDDINRKREFIVRHSDKIQPKYRREMTKRNFNYAYYFTISGTKVRVCKTFFKLTLDINDRTIDTAQKKRTDYGTVAQDGRGRHGNHNKIDTEIKEDVRRHIMSIPRVESHYLRAQTTKEFIDGGKTIADLHRDYQVLCRNNNTPAANYHMYSDIFNREFNISFFVPKKDQCNLCYVYLNANPEEKENMKTEYEDHQNEKVLSRNEMDIDKKKVNETYTVACFDMQAVLQFPKGDISIFYYKSKLNAMNFTVTEMSNDATQCYVWHEGEGGKGATEVGSCMLSYLQEESIKRDSDDLEIVLYSDNCGAQQKNRFLIAVFMYAVMKFKIKCITHKYLVVGHTQNPGDSAHSTIEKQVTRSLKTGPIFVPDQFVTLIRLAKKKGNPYDVKELTHDDFFNVKQLMADFGSNFTVNSKGKQVFISNLRIVKVEKAHPWQYFYKTSFSDLEFEYVNVKDPKTLIKTRKSTRKTEIDSNLTDVPKLHKAYLSKLPLNENKKKDLKFLLEKGFIPKYYSPFYSSLF